MKLLNLVPCEDSGLAHTLTATCTCNPKREFFMEGLDMLTHHMVGDGPDKWTFISSDEKGGTDAQ